MRATLHWAVSAFKVLQICGCGRWDESGSKIKKLSTKPSSRPRIYYTDRQYNVTIMIRIKFTPCASWNGACRRRRTLRFGIESNLGSNPFGACMYVTFLGGCSFKSIASTSTCIHDAVRQQRVNGKVSARFIID